MKKYMKKYIKKMGVHKKSGIRQILSSLNNVVVKKIFFQYVLETKWVDECDVGI